MIETASKTQIIKYLEKFQIDADELEAIAEYFYRRNKDVIKVLDHSLTHAREFNLAMLQGKTYYKQKWKKTT
ncbi:hypothetical protein QMA56_10630 [Leuconostoc falkenbergense]|uniref:hypothetical protein n=1 Tax=Leuconostoc falkenbergense TaxID=2766470 RepID=UPI0024AD2351|nr:hypothetical protein [Leuconostoc falkenbergense]MDI6668152.1 hypothetical protein [Leuconostoc falkenbergense]